MGRPNTHRTQDGEFRGEWTNGRTRIFVEMYHPDYGEDPVFECSYLKRGAEFLATVAVWRDDALADAQEALDRR